MGHDNNRDSYMVAQPETENMARILYREWYPQIMYNHHQVGPSGTIMWAPPFREPFNYNFDPLLIFGLAGFPRLELQGAATATVGWSPDRVPLRAEVVVDGNNLTATLHNEGDISFWAWGVGNSTTARAASGPLDPGQTGTATLRGGLQGFNQGGGLIADAVLSQGNWDWSGGGPDPWQRVWPGHSS